MKAAVLYPANAPEKLEFNKILQEIRSKCLSVLGERFLDKMTVSADFDFITKALKQVDDFKYLLEHDSSFPGENYTDLFELINYLEIEASVLSETQFLELMLFLRTVRDIFLYFERRKEKYASLEGLLRGEVFEAGLLKSIEAVIDEEGQVRNGVSPQLDKLRKGLRDKEKALDRKFQSILMLAQSKGWLEQGGESIRNGRRVLALHSENKRSVKGIIHDESATGKTVFVEPEETIELSNEWFELKQEERREIFRILKELSAQVRPHISSLRFYQKLIGLFDFIRAKSLYSLQINATVPELMAGPEVNYIKAFHPVLWSLHHKAGKPTIPLSASLSNQNKILVISGPNAGGKSVALKTFGLLQLMVQSGLPIPASPDSKVGIFDKIFVELGDEQSIENDLSTYSSHLTHMKYFCEEATEKTLFLIDEFGTGTDPKFGGAIAEAVLDKLHKKNAFGVVTTHYSNLKLYATNTRGISNASMLFDKQKLLPLFVLNFGQPGSSFAYEIAQKIGLPKDVLQNAESNIDKEYQQFDSLLSTMETDKHVMGMMQERIESREQELATLIETYQSLKDDLEKNKKQILLENKQKSLDDISKINKKFEGLLRELQEKGKTKDIQQIIRKEIAQQRDELQVDVTALKTKKKAKVEVEDLTIGSRVKIGDSAEIGTVEQLRNNRALVSFNNMRTLVDITELSLVKGVKTDSTETKGTGFNRAAIEFNPEIDVRGKRPEEVMEEVEKLLDKAMLLNFSSLRIIHGRGNGVLRKTVRTLLKKYDIVKEVSSESPDFGGDGVTLIELKG